MLRLSQGHTGASGGDQSHLLGLSTLLEVCTHCRNRLLVIIPLWILRKEEKMMMIIQPSNKNEVFLVPACLLFGCLLFGRRLLFLLVAHSICLVCLPSFSLFPLLTPPPPPYIYIFLCMSRSILGQTIIGLILSCWKGICSNVLLPFWSFYQFASKIPASEKMNMTIGHFSYLKKGHSLEMKRGIYWGGKCMHYKGKIGPWYDYGNMNSTRFWR